MEPYLTCLCTPKPRWSLLHGIGPQEVRVVELKKNRDHDDISPVKHNFGEIIEITENANRKKEHFQDGVKRGGHRQQAWASRGRNSAGK